MSTAFLVVLNVGLLVVFIILLRQPDLLGYAKGGRWYLSWMAIAIITLMDELTSVFYAPAEAHRFIGEQAIFFIAFTSLLMRFLCSRMVEIAEILEFHDIRGGGVYSFSYLVLGPAVSFAAVASIMVDYILTACLSSVSAVINGAAFFDLSAGAQTFFVLTVIWAVAGLNILGIRENVRVTFYIFTASAFVFVNLIALGIIHMDPQSPEIVLSSVSSTWSDLSSGGLANVVQVITIGVASCVLAYSGIESVLQTASLVEGWRQISKAYWFLALTVGIVTPMISALALSAPIDFAAHEGDLIVHWATMVGNAPFGLVVSVLASVILIMAVNTAYVASGELMERVAHRYRLHWLTATNHRLSLYRIHLLNACLYTIIIFLTSGSQQILAEMYAIGLLASFCINIGALLIYRYFRGTKESLEYNTSRVGTLLLEAVLLACFFYLAVHKPYGLSMWAAVVFGLLAVGIPFSRRYGPEREEVRRSDHPMEMILALAEADCAPHIYLRRPGELDVNAPSSGTVFVSFFSPRQQIPERLAPNHFRFPMQGSGVYRSITALLHLVEEEFAGQPIYIHLGWPLSSWLDRMATGVFVANVMRLPAQFPQLTFSIEYSGSSPRPGGGVA